MTDKTQVFADVADLIHDVFKLNSLLVLHGDRMFADLGLTSARMQVFGVAALADPPKPVAALARDLGTTRQGVQRIVNDLVAAGLVALAPNPNHRRAHLVTVTDKGRQAHAAAIALRRPLMEHFAEHLPPADIAAARRVLAIMRAQLEEETANELEEQT